jgi:cytochrome c
MKKVVLWLAVLGLCLLMGFSVAMASKAKESQVETLVEKAAQTFKEKGKDYTLRLLNASRGPFRKKELYVFAVSMDGKTLSHPTNKKLRGKDVWNLKGAKGKLFIQEFVKVAKDPGSGWVDYWWLRHGEKEPTLKRSYILKVPGEDILVGCGYYIK